TKEAILDGRKKHHGNESHLGPHRVNDERHGAHRTRGLLMADVRCPGRGGLDGTRHVDRHSLCYSALPGNGGVLRRTGQALSGHRQFVLLRRAVLSESRQALALRSAFEVHRRMGLSPVLLDLSGSDGGGYGDLLWLCGGNAVAERHE